MNITEFYNRIFNQRNFKRTGLITCSFVFLLFLLGGLVRATGSGMGCPDWPKCFGLWVPPSCSCELPADYKDVFLQKRKIKVQKMANTFEKMGFVSYAQELRSNKKIYEPEEFNATKAWIEYINRIFGVLSGLSAVVFFVFTLVLKDRNKGVLAYVAIAFALLIFNAWLGSLVVATNLLPGTITLHFVTTFFCIYFFYLAVNKQTRIFSISAHTTNKKIVFWLLAFTLLEIVVGTFTRERVDFLKELGRVYIQGGEFNFPNMGRLFQLHRILAFSMLGIFGVYYWQLRKRQDNSLKRWVGVLIILIVLQSVSGIVNAKFHFPAVTQVFHIFIGAAIPTLIFIIHLAIPKMNK